MTQIRRQAKAEWCSIFKWALLCFSTILLSLFTSCQRLKCLLPFKMFLCNDNGLDTFTNVVPQITFEVMQKWMPHYYYGFEEQACHFSNNSNKKSPAHATELIVGNYCSVPGGILLSASIFFKTAHHTFSCTIFFSYIPLSLGILQKNLKNERIKNTPSTKKSFTLFSVQATGRSEQYEQWAVLYFLEFYLCCKVLFEFESYLVCLIYICLSLM